MSAGSPSLGWTPVLYDVASALESVEGPEERIERVLSLARRFVPYDRCALKEADPVLDRPVTVLPKVSEEEESAVSVTLSRLIDLLSEHPLEEAASVEVAGSSGRAHLAVPIMGLGEISGMIYVEREEPHYQEPQLAFLSVVAAQIGAYLSSVRAHRELHASESRFRRLFESGMIGMVFMSEDGLISSCNDVFASVMGLPLGELGSGSMSWFDLTPLHEADRDRKAIRMAAKEGASPPYEKVFLREGREPVPVIAGFAGIREGVVAFVLDISVQKRAEDERAGLLEQRESDLRFLEMFMGMLGHDLRNPLGAIRMSAELLKLTEIDGKRRSVVERMLSSTDRMERMVEQLLDLTQIRLAGGMPLSPSETDLAGVCARAVDELRAVHPDTPIELEVTGDAGGLWDGDRLLQALSNLVGNAVQHRRGEGAVSVEIRPGGDAIEVEVSNPGEIPAERLPGLFEPFRRTKGEGKKKGLGLGLFISRHIIEAHGGRLEVKSSQEAGTSFMVHLPRRSRKGSSGQQ